MSGARWRRRRALLAMLAALLAWGGAGRQARADVESAPIHMDVVTCPAQWDPDIRLALAVELNDERLADAASADEGPAHRLSIRCAEDRVWIVARDAKTGATLERTMTGDLPAATAPRIVAMVAVELLTTFDPALRRRDQAPAKPSQPAPPPVAALSTAAPVAAAPSPLDAHRFSLTAGGVYRTFLSTGGLHAWGGEVGARRVSRDGRWTVGGGVEIAGADRATTIGEISAVLVSASASAGALARLAGGRLALSFEVGARGGAARLSGHADDPKVVASRVVRPWAGPVATARAELAVSSVVVELSAEAGWAAVSASGLVAGGAALAASGPWLAISLGLGTRR